MLKKTVFLSLVLFFLFSVALSAQRIYVGAGVGNAFRNHKLTGISGSDFALDKGSFSWKAFGGVQWNFLALEGGYVDFGRVEDVQNDLVIYDDTRGGDLFARGILNISFLELSGKAGVFFRNTEIQDITDSQGFDEVFQDTKKGAHFAWGVGAGVNFGLLGLRLEWESFEINPDNLSLLSLSAIVGFGGK